MVDDIMVNDPRVNDTRVNNTRVNGINISGTNLNYSLCCSFTLDFGLIIKINVSYNRNMTVLQRTENFKKRDVCTQSKRLFIGEPAIPAPDVPGQSGN